MKDIVTIFTDGGARGNPGPAGAGAVVYEGASEVATVSQFLGKQTNNWAEYEALILGLKAATDFYKGKKLSADVYMDSELIVKQMKGEYKVKNPELKKQYARASKIITDNFSLVSFKHVVRELNARADELANHAMDNPA